MSLIELPLMAADECDGDIPPLCDVLADVRGRGVILLPVASRRIAWPPLAAPASTSSRKKVRMKKKYGVCRYMRIYRNILYTYLAMCFVIPPPLHVNTPWQHVFAAASTRNTLQTSWSSVRSCMQWLLRVTCTYDPFCQDGFQQTTRNAGVREVQLKIIT